MNSPVVGYRYLKCRGQQRGVPLVVTLSIFAIVSDSFSLSKKCKNDRRLDVTNKKELKTIVVAEMRQALCIA